jgi:Xaa-Pro aminopeptidase
VRVIVLVCLLAAALPIRAAAVEGIPLDEYRARREALRKKLDGGVFVLIGSAESEHGDMRSPFFQESSFYYLTGWNEPGAMLVITPREELVFVPARNPEREKWTGPKAASGDADVGRVTGFGRVLPAGEFEAWVRDHVASWSGIYSLAKAREGDRLQKLCAGRQLLDATPAVAELRMKKSASELALIERSVRITDQAHRAAWNRMRPGLFEYQIAATMSNVYFEAGCERHAYPPIVASGANAVTLHYNANSRRFDAGELVLMDVGAECSRYAADLTRTVPASGKFTRRQREVYEAVLEAQQAAIAAVRPGATLSKTGAGSLYKVAMDRLRRHGLGKYFTHNIGHHVGLDVHDLSDAGQPLEAGMVITIEPGVYIPEEGIGIRIEDMVLVTKNGGRVLTSGLPKDPDAIEKALARGR